MEPDIQMHVRKAHSESHIAAHRDLMKHREEFIRRLTDKLRNAHADLAAESKAAPGVSGRQTRDVAEISIVARQRAFAEAHYHRTNTPEEAAQC